MFFSTRAFKRRQLIIILLLLQSIVIYNRLESNDATEKFLNKNTVVVENFLLFLFQNENDNDFLFEQHDNYDNFNSNIEVE